MRPPNSQNCARHLPRRNGVPQRPRPISRRLARWCGGAAVRRCGGVDLRGDDRGAQAGDRDPQAQQVWAQRGTDRPAHRSVGTAARGTGGRCRRGCHPRRTCGTEDDPGHRLRTAQARQESLSRTSAARARGGRGPSRLHMLRVGPHREDGRGHPRNAGGGAAAVEGHPDRPHDVPGVPPVHASKRPPDGLSPAASRRSPCRACEKISQPRHLSIRSRAAGRGRACWP